MVEANDIEFVDRFTRVQKRGKYLYYPDKNGKKMYELCGDVYPSKILMNLVKGDVKHHLRYWINGGYQELVLDRRDLTKSGLISVLPSRGVQITENTAGILLDYLLYMEKRTKVQYVHDRIGFITINGEKLFLHEKAHSKSGVIDSSYCGDLAIGCKGSIEGELKLIREEVKGHIPLETAWTLGFAAPILCLLRDMIALDNCIVHSYSRSSTGKTSSSLLSVSMFGVPSKNNPNGLYGSWASTPNALLARLNDVMGVPMVYDEAGILEAKVYAKVIYQMSSGLEKARLTSDSTLREKARFSTLIISNGENAILNDSNRNNGLKVRVLQFANVVWTRDSQNSTQITERLMENYGNSGVHFIKEILKYSDEELLCMFKDAKEHVMKSLAKTDDFSSRTSDKIAVIFMTSKLINKVFDIGLDEEGILHFLIKADESQVEDRNLGLQAYMAIKEQITANLNKFVFKDNSPGHQAFTGQPEFTELPRSEIIGRLVTGSNKIPQEAWILRSKLDMLLKDAGFIDPEVVLSEWKEHQIIDADKGKYTRKRTLYNRGDSVRVVVIRLKGTEYDSVDNDSDSTIEQIREVKGIHFRSIPEELEQVDDELYEDDII